MMKSDKVLDQIHQSFLNALNRQTPAFSNACWTEKRPVQDFLRGLTMRGVADKLAYIDRTVTTAEFRKMLSNPEYPFLYFTGTVEASSCNFIIQSQSLSEEEYANVLSSELGIPIVGAFPLAAAEDSFLVGEYEKKHPVSKLISLLKEEKKDIVYILLYAVFVGIIGLSLPLGVQSLIGFISSGQMVTSAVVLIIFILLGIILSGVMTIFQLEVVERLQQHLFARTAFSFAYRIPKIRLESVLKYYPPELMNRFFDTLTLQKGIPVLLIDLSAAILQVVFGIVLLSFYHPLFIVLGAILALLLYLVIRITGRKAVATAMEESDYKYKVANWLEELARSLTTFKLSGDSGLAMEKTDQFVGNYIRAREKHFSVLRIQYFSFVIFKTVITAVLLVLGLTLIFDRQLNLGQFVAAEIVIILIMNSIEKIILKIDDVYDVLAGVEKISKVTELPLERQDGIRLAVDERYGMKLDFDRVSFRFPGRDTPSVDELSFGINSGERICIAGENGSGKSTVLQLLLGIFPTDSGLISFNGVSLKELDKSALMNHIGNYVSQDTLFDGTVLENITLGRRFLKMEDVFWAIDAAGVKDYIDSLPNGLSTRLVGGAAQVPVSTVHKLILARNLVERPSLMVIDDFLLGVESASKRKILELLLDRKQPWSVLLVSNDPMVLQQVDRILFLEKGRLKAEGDFVSLQSAGILTNITA